MSVYVDPQMNCLRSKAWPYAQSCHLYADTLDELHAFAQGLGLKRAWFQLSRGLFPHYDLNPSRRVAAVAMGAIQHDRQQAVDMWRAKGWRRPLPESEAPHAL